MQACLVTARPAIDLERRGQWLAEDPAHYRSLVESIPAVTYVQRMGAVAEVVYVSPQAAAITGWNPEDYVAHPEYWLTLVHPLDRDRVRVEVRRAKATGEPLQVEYRVATPDERTVWLRDMAVMADDVGDGAQVWQGIQVDITADKVAEMQLHRLAFYDPLTGLPNRRLCIDRLQALLDQTAWREVALLFLDLDRFKVINDGIGHAAGDRLLVAVAQRLAPHVAGRGMLARFGGDEFVDRAGAFRGIAGHRGRGGNPLAGPAPPVQPQRL